MSEIIDKVLVKGKRLHIKQHTLPAGAKTLRHHHKKTFEIYYVVEGAGKLIRGDKTIQLKPGMTVKVRAGVSHQLINDEMLDLVVNSTKDQPITLKDFYVDA